MSKLNFYRPLANVLEHSVISLLTAALASLITFNLGWLLTFVRISWQL